MQSPNQSPVLYTDDKSIVFAAISVSTVLFLLLVALSTVSIISVCVGIKMHQKQIRNKGILVACSYKYECFSLRVIAYMCKMFNLFLF